MHGRDPKSMCVAILAAFCGSDSPEVFGACFFDLGSIVLDLLLPVLWLVCPTQVRTLQKRPQTFLQRGFILEALAVMVALCGSLHVLFATEHAGGVRHLIDARLHVVVSGVVQGVVWALVALVLYRQRAHKQGSIYFTILLVLLLRAVYAAFTGTQLLRQQSGALPVECLRSRLWGEWEKEKQAHLTSLVETRKGGQPSLLHALARVYGWPYLALGVVKLLNEALTFTGPLLLNQLVKHLTRDSPQGFAARPSWIPAQQSPAFGYWCAGLLGLTAVLKAILNSQYSFRQGRISCQLRAALTCLVFRKTLLISSLDMAALSSGMVQTLMSVDADRIVNLCLSLHDLWCLPASILLALYLLYMQVKFAFVGGLIVVLVLIPINRLLANKIQAASERMMACKDTRLQCLAELLRGIRQIKLAAWEHIFVSKVEAARQGELEALAVRKYTDALCVFFWAATSVMFSLFTFGLFVLLGHHLSASIVFTSLALFNVLLGPLNSFPWVLNGIVEALVSVKRLQAPARRPGIRLRHASFTWAPTAWPVAHNDLVLKDISLSIPCGSLTVVQGPVGAGKSTLLLALLGELRQVAGSSWVATGPVAYAPQNPFLLAGTLRDNILFGKPYDAVRFQQVVSACALQLDLQALPKADLTAVGDRGLTLSGGQRARVGLARAVYQGCDVYLLDDIFASLDAPVAALVLDNVIRGPLLARTTRLVCTHSQHCAAAADQVVLLECGGSARILPGPGSQLGHTSGVLDAASTSSSVDGGFEIEPADERGEAWSGADAPIIGPAAPAPLRPTAAAPAQLAATEEASGQCSDMEDGQEEARQAGSVHWRCYLLYMRATGWPLVALIFTSLLLMQASRQASDLWLSYWVSHVRKEEDEAPRPSSHQQSVPSLRSLASASTAPMMLGALLPLALLYRWLAQYYQHSSRELRRLNSIARSPVYATFHTVLAGLPSIRAYQAQPCFELLNQTQVAAMQQTSLASLAASQWLALRLQLLAACLVAGVAGLAVLQQDGHLPAMGGAGGRAFGAGLVGLSLAYALPITGLLNGLLTSAAETEQEMVAVERLAEYSALEPQAVTLPACAGHVHDGASGTVSLRPGTGRGPQVGCISFDQVSLRYVEPGPYALAGVNLEVAAGQKVGICGQTGAGKSSMVAALLRLTEITSGAICVDGRDVRSLPLPHLRSIVGCVPQSPFLFQGTIRQNLDPLARHSDREMITILKQVHLWDILCGLSLSQSKDMRASHPLRVAPPPRRPPSGTASPSATPPRTPHAAKPSAPVASPSGTPPRSPRVDAAHRLARDARPRRAPPAEAAPVPQRGLSMFNWNWRALGEDASAGYLVRSGFGGQLLSVRLGEGGVGLSQGQQQLLCLARILLRKPRIVCLDESTANVDPITAQLMQDLVQTCLRQATVLQVAHRLHHITSCDRVVVMEAGRVVEEGAPNDLLKQPGSRFAHMVASQH
ncbi:hypothetical protein WJX72_011744 [[Myrmecia] bisecta]|uniref:ABC-type xenobiotic transporter n=1 Tax=[Myrmecia] bisecta TaxID=41462 RepID=A0AAW1RA35_9CHLO